MNEIVSLDRPVIWACGCGCPRMWAYRDGKLKCSDCEQWQSFELPETDSLRDAATELLSAFDSIIQQCGHDTCPKGWLAAANRMRQLISGDS